MNIFDHYRQRYEAAKDEEFTLQEFLTICRQDRSAYANAAERLLMALVTGMDFGLGKATLWVFG